MISTVSLNACIDKVYYIEEEIESGTVMRVKRVKNSAGGKGVSAARIIHLCGGQALAAGLVGGHNGQYLKDMLKKDGVKSRFTSIAGETRSCINIIDAKYSSTEFLEPGATVSELELERFLEDYRGILKDSKMVILSGSIAQGLPATIYQTLTEIAHKEGVRVILDSSGEPFRQGLKAKPDMVKPNQFELEHYFQVTIKTVDEAVCYGKKLAEEGIDYVVVSLGGEGAVLIHHGKVYRALAPKVKVVNTAGCGDALVGGFAEALYRNFSAADCLRFAVAAGSANALKIKTGDLDIADFDKIYQQVGIDSLED